MKYKSDNLYNYEQKSWWIFEIFKNIRHVEDKPRNFYRNEWFEFHPLMWGVYTTYEKAGYFDERPQLSFYVSQLLGIILIPILIFNFSWWFLLITFTLSIVGVGKIYLNLPFKTGINECESPEWGFYLYTHDGITQTNLVFCLGDKNKYISFPWNLQWYRTSYVKCANDLFTELQWIDTYSGDKNDYWDTEKHKDTFWVLKTHYTYVLTSGEVQKRIATVKVVEREWRRRWLMWTPLFNKVVRSIDVEFDDEVGERTGSWKGGTVGCSYELKPNETPYQCLKRMEKERKF